MKSPLPPTRPPLRDNRPPQTRAARSPAPALARFTGEILADLARKTRFVDPELAAKWPRLAGEEVAGLCRPGRLTGGREGRTLEVIVPHGAAAAVVSAASEALRLRLNDYFGPDAIARIAIVQGGGHPGARGGLSRFRTG